MRLAWFTDIHLNFLNQSEITAFLQSLPGNRPDSLVLTGDIGEADTISGYLTSIASSLNCPVFFVLGNHDFYRGSVSQVRAEMTLLEQQNQNLVYLTNGHIRPLASKTCLVGHDGWPDGRNGDYEHSSVLLNDFLLIRDFRRPDQSIPRLDPEVRRYWLEVMRRLADDATAQLERTITAALADYSHILIATHVPPYRESSQYNGILSRDDYQPFFSSKGMGEMLTRVALENPSAGFTVLCGHSHWPATYSPTPNLVVHTGGAEYGQPAIQKIWTF